MEVIPYPSEVDLSLYAEDAEDPEAFCGLPKDVAFCKSCVISNQRPNSTVEFKHTIESRKTTINLDDEGVCDACRVAEDKNTAIDWDAREEELEALCEKHRRHDGNYDCLVPGSGGKDSFYAAHILKNKYGMHPLTVTWAPHVYTEWGWKNFQSWIHAGFDNYLMTPNGRTHRLLTRLAVETLFHPFQAFVLGQKNLAPKMALLFDIPLVFYGENEAEYGNPKGDTGTARRDSSFFAQSGSDDVYLGGVSVKDLREQFGVPEIDLKPYLPADPAQLDSAFMAANGAALDAKLSQYSAAQRDELLGKKSDLEVLGMSAKDLDKFFNPPPPKAKAPAKK